VIFYKSNRIDDPGHDVPYGDLLEEFMDPPVFADWKEHHGIRLARVVMQWIAEEHGSLGDVPHDTYVDLIDQLVEDVLERGRS
jgi:hypothetical protein